MKRGLPDNEQQFDRFLSDIEPQLWRVWKVVQLTGFNQELLIPVIRAIHNIAQGTGYGKVVIEVREGQVIFVRGEENTLVNLPVRSKDVK